MVFFIKKFMKYFVLPDKISVEKYFYRIIENEPGKSISCYN